MEAIKLLLIKVIYILWSFFFSRVNTIFFSYLQNRYFFKKKFLLTRPSYHELPFFDTFLCMCFFDNNNIKKYTLYVKHLNHISLRRAIIYPLLYNFFCYYYYDANRTYPNSLNSVNKINYSYNEKKKQSNFISQNCNSNVIKYKILVAKKVLNIHTYYSFLNYNNNFSHKYMYKEYLISSIFFKLVKENNTINDLELIYKIWAYKNIYSHSDLIKLFHKNGFINFEKLAGYINFKFQKKFTASDFLLLRTKVLKKNQDSIIYTEDYLPEIDKKILKTSTRAVNQQRNNKKKNWEEKIKEKKEKIDGVPAYKRNSFRITFAEKLTDYKHFYNKIFEENTWNYWNKQFLLKFYKKFYSIFDQKFNNIVKTKLKKYKILFKPTDVSKELLKKSNLLENDFTPSTFFLRKNKIFNKGRYSRNRQLYRTGVYWCLWLNVISVYGLYLYFYKFVFNFGYIYLPLLILILSIFGSKIVRYRFYNYKNIVNELSSFLDYLLSNMVVIKFFKSRLLTFFKKKLTSSFYKNTILLNLYKYIFFKK